MKELCFILQLLELLYIIILVQRFKKSNKWFFLEFNTELIIINPKNEKNFNLFMLKVNDL